MDTRAPHIGLKCSKRSFGSTSFLWGLLACCLAGFSVRLGAQAHDLEVRLQPPAGLALLGELVSLRVTVTNHGPGAASGVSLTNVCSTNAVVFSTLPSQGSCIPFSNGVRCDLGALPSGTEATVTVSLTPQTPGLVSLHSSAGSGVVDAVPANNFAQANFTAVPPTFHPGPNLVIGRRNHAAALLADGRVLIVGGVTATGHTATVEVFDTNSGSFRLTGSMRTTREYPTATALTNGTVLVVGGERAELFDPAAEEFSDVGPTAKPRWGHAATPLLDGRVLITGGVDPFDTYWSPFAEVYHPGSNGFFRVGNMLHGRYHHSTVRLADGRVLIAGGSGAANWAEIFNPSSNSFAATGDMVAGNWWPTLTLLTNGQVLVAKPYGPAPNSELYDPSTGAFSALSDLFRPIKAETATLLQNGQVLVCPGLTGELYDPATQRFTDTIPMTKTRTGFTATRLHDGRVLIVGGDETTEFYVPDQVKLLPQISILDASIAEGDTGSRVLSFPLLLSYPMAVPVSVEYFLTAGSADWANGDLDYTNSFAVIPPGVTNASVNVTLHGDLDYESDEQFVVHLRQPTNALVARAQATGTILNDDPIPAVAVVDAQAEERTATFALSVPVVLSAASIHPITVGYSTTDGTAVSPGDYLARNGELFFAPGVRTQFVQIPIKGDLEIEADETFHLTLTGASNATVARALAAITILNDDGFPGRLHHFEFAAIPFPQYPGRPVPVQVMARDYFGDPVTNFSNRVKFRASSTDAPSHNFDFETDGLDGWTPLLTGYSPGPYEITDFDVSGDGVPSAAFRLTPDYDTPPDGLSRLVTLRGGTAYAVSADFALHNSNTYESIVEAYAYIRVGGTLVGAVNLTDYGYAEVISPGFTYRKTIVGQFTAPTNGLYPLEISFYGYSSDPGLWAYADNLRVQFPPLTLSRTNWFTNGVWAGDILFTNQAGGVVLEVIDAEGHIGTSEPFDLLPQTDLAVQTTVSSPVPHVGYPITFTVAVTNRGPLTAPAVRLTNVLEGRGSFLSATASPGSCTVESNILTCELGAITNGGRATISIVAKSPVTGWITNITLVSSSLPDAFPDNNVFVSPQPINPAPLYMANTTVTEPDTGMTDATVTLFLEYPSAEWLSVDYSTMPGTALAGLDFLAATGHVVFPPGVMTQFVTVQVLGDAIDEAAESFYVGISNPTNAVVANTGTGRITIVDSDPPPVMSVADTVVLEGNAGTTQALFEVTLSAPSSQTIYAYWATSDGTALFGTDYSSVPVSAPNANALVTFLPGTTNQTLSVTVKGDRLSESNETFFVTLYVPINVTFGRSSAMATILNDDGLPGEIDHFQWSYLGDEIFEDFPVAVEVTARDAAGGVATNFQGPILFSIGSSDSPGVNLDFEGPTLEPWIPLNAGSRPGPYRLVDFDTAGIGVSSRSFQIEPDYLSPDGIRQDMRLLGNTTYRFSLDAAVAVALVSQPARALRIQVNVGGQNVVSAAVQSFLRGHFAGSFTAPTNGIYSVEIVAWHDLAGRAFGLYFDNLRIVPEAPAAPALANHEGTLSNGIWRGTIRLTGTGTNVLLRADDGDGHWGHSAAFLVRSSADADGDSLPDAWELDYFAALDSANASPFADPDEDGLRNREEFLAGTSPIDVGSAPRLRAAVLVPDVGLTFDTVPGRRYVVERSDHFDGPWLRLGSSQLGTGGEITIMDIGASLGLHRFYRLAVER